jgi:hypothetical protein
VALSRMVALQCGQTRVLPAVLVGVRPGNKRSTSVQIANMLKVDDIHPIRPKPDPQLTNTTPGTSVDSSALNHKPACINAEVPGVLTSS